MRVFAESASKALNQTVIVDNKPGAGGTLGAVELVNAKPDGYTLAQLPISVLRIPHMQKVQFDALKDFTWIACLTGYTFGLVVRADSPIKHIPFKGVAEGMQSLLGGHIMGHSDSTGWAPHVEAGRLRLLATYGSKRTKRWSHVPTLEELGYQTVSDSPYGVCGPKGMDSAVVRQIQNAFKATLDDPVVIASLEKFDQPVIYLDTTGYTQYVRDTFQAEKATIERLGMTSKS